MAGSSDTPAMRQHARFKAQHPGCVLFFRMGDFYELFGDDAVEMSKALGLTLTKRSGGLPLAGVPHQRLNDYLSRAVAAGYRVAICDQIQDPKDAKGVVDRAVTRVVTPGTMVEDDLVAGEDTIRLAAAILDDESAGLASIDLGSGEFLVRSLGHDQLTDELARLSVRELLVDAEGDARSDAARRLGVAITVRDGWQFRADEAVRALSDHFRVATLDGFGLEAGASETRAAGALLRYLLETQAGVAAFGAVRSATLDHIRPPRRDEPGQRMLLDAVSLRALEIERTIRGQSLAGSLAGLFVRGSTACRTPMGKRLIREWLKAPLCDAGAIVARQDGVALLVADRDLARELSGLLDGIQDIARITGRLALGRVTPRDLVGLGQSAGRARALCTTLAGLGPLEPVTRALAGVCSTLEDLAEAIVGSCVESPPAHLREGGLIVDGRDAELDEARLLQRDAGAWLATYQAELIDRHELPSLRVGFNKVFGYYIELPAAQARRAPPEFTRKQTLKNAERYITPELKSFEDKATTAEARAIEREQAIFAELCELACAQLATLQHYAELIATLDAMLAFADKAHSRGWAKPSIVEEPVLQIAEGRHPVLDESLAGEFVPNGVELGAPDPSLALITGPNMAGKSTFIRQTALITLLAHAGSFVPASSAMIGVCDRIFTRVGADDALHEGQSTFMVEMAETANILNHATAHSLVILDEIGRGTSTLDGLSLAWAITEHLADLGARTLFATHYHEITDLEDRLPSRVANLRVSAREWKDEIVFLHAVERGRADQSYGVQVARLAGVPACVIRRAREILDRLRVTEAQAIAPPPGPPRVSSGQLGLFTEYLEHPVLDDLRGLDLDAMSPMQAFDALRSLRDRLDSR